MVEKLMCCLTVAASVLLAQAPAPNASPSGLVRLSVAAVDASGEPVTDFEDGRLSDSGSGQAAAHRFLPLEWASVAARAPGPA